MKKRLRFVLASITVLLAGCSPSKGNTPTPTPTFPITPTVSPTQTPSESPTPTPTKTYEKDEEGFYILEDDYFVHKEIDENKLSFAEKLANIHYANNYRLFFGDTEIPLYGVNTNPSRVWTPNPTDFIEAGVGIVNLDGPATFILQTNFAFKEQSTSYKNT